MACPRRRHRGRRARHPGSREPFDIDEIAASLRHRHQRESFSIVVVAEGATPIPGTLDFAPIEGPAGGIVAGAVGERVRAELTDRTGLQTRLVVLGHVQRGGPPRRPTAFWQRNSESPP